MATEKKTLYRSRDERMIAGVCGGLAEYFEIDATLVRLLFVAAALLGGPGLLAYLICLVLMPLEPTDEPIPASPVAPEQEKSE
jgi:phage shock protein PspC (stress-responsive transcriptional regulator)